MNVNLADHELPAGWPSSVKTLAIYGAQSPF